MRLEVEKLSHRYGRLEVLEALDFTVEEGETLAVAGPSGCGKSTLLGIMGGLLRPSAGTVRMAGPEPEDCLNPLTYVFQDFALLPWRTVEANVALPLEGRLPRAQVAERVAAALEKTGLAAFARAFPKQLSGGMRQRVGIARALVVRPAVLLLDEPLSALDAQTRELLIEELSLIRRNEATTAVWVTHNLDEAVRIADRILVLSRRPARIRRIVEVPVPQGARAEPARAAELAACQAMLWSLIVDEVRAADRELEPADALA